MSVLRGIALAPAAAAWLAGTDSARVLNVFDRACNLISRRGSVLALVSSERGLTPFGLVVAGGGGAPFRGLPADSSVRINAAAQRLQIGALTIDYGGAAVWEARPDWLAVRALWRRSPVTLARLAALAAPLPSPGSLLDLYRSPASRPASADALLASARRGAAQIVAGLAAGDGSRAAAGAQALAGLGGGLTPAGDDFIVGALLAAWAGLYGLGAERLAPLVAAAAAPRTTTLSAAYLEAAGRGECMAHWHDLLRTLLRDDWAGTEAALQALAAVGHTSGADALAGFLAGYFETAVEVGPGHGAAGRKAPGP